MKPAPDHDWESDWLDIEDQRVLRSLDDAERQRINEPLPSMEEIRMRVWEKFNAPIHQWNPGKNRN